MQVLKISQKSYSFLYDFSIDGGAVGSYNTGLQFPKQSLIVNAYFQILIPITSIGLDIKIGTNTQPAGYAELSGIVNADQSNTSALNIFQPPFYSQSNGELVIMTFATNPALSGKAKFIFIVEQGDV